MIEGGEAKQYVGLYMFCARAMQTWCGPAPAVGGLDPALPGSSEYVRSEGKYLYVALVLIIDAAKQF